MDPVFAEKLQTQIEIAVESGKRNFLIYPYGMAGEFAKSVLNEHSIEPVAVFDEYKSSAMKPCKIVEYIEKDVFLILAAQDRKTYFSCKDYVYSFFPKANVILPLYYREDFDHIQNSFLEHRNNMSENECIYTFNSHSTKMWLPQWKDDVLQKEIVLDDCYSEEATLFFYTKTWKDGIIEKTIRNKAVIDIGANIGNHSLYYAIECKAQKIYSFEPIKDTYEILKRNVGLNGLDNIIELYNIAVGEKETKGDCVFFDSHNIGASRINESETGSIIISTIDSFEFCNVGLIKIDVEEYEINAIKGALRTIEKNLPFIVMEVWDYTHHIFEIIDILKPLGYQFERISECDYLFWCIRN